MLDFLSRVWDGDSWEVLLRECSQENAMKNWRNQNGQAACDFIRSLASAWYWGWHSLTPLLCRGEVRSLSPWIWVPLGLLWQENMVRRCCAGFQVKASRNWWLLLLISWKSSSWSPELSCKKPKNHFGETTQRDTERPGKDRGLSQTQLSDCPLRQRAHEDVGHQGLVQLPANHHWNCSQHLVEWKTYPAKFYLNPFPTDHDI